MAGCCPWLKKIENHGWDSVRKRVSAFSFFGMDISLTEYYSHVHRSSVDAFNVVMHQNNLKMALEEPFQGYFKQLT